MRKVLGFLLAASMMLSLVACGNTATETNQDAPKEDVVMAEVIDIELTQEQYAFGVDKDQPELLADVNTFIKKIMDDGTFEAICDKYFGDGTPEGVESAAKDDSKDQLLVATNAQFAPFEYKEGDKYYGIDMEIAALLAKELNKELVIMDMEFDAVCLTVGQHKCDIAMAGLTVNEKREEYVTFSESYYNAAQKLIVPSDSTEFDACKTVEDVEAILKAKDETCKVGVQTGTTGELYCVGDEDWGFDGFGVETKGYKNGSLAVQDLLNGNIDYVVIDAAPAAAITEAINEMR